MGIKSLMKKYKVCFVCSPEGTTVHSQGCKSPGTEGLKSVLFAVPEGRPPKPAWTMRRSTPSGTATLFIDGFSQDLLPRLLMVVPLGTEEEDDLWDCDDDVACHTPRTVRR